MLSRWQSGRSMNLDIYILVMTLWMRMETIYPGSLNYSMASLDLAETYEEAIDIMEYRKDYLYIRKFICLLLEYLRNIME